MSRPASHYILAGLKRADATAGHLAYVVVTTTRRRFKALVGAACVVAALVIAFNIAAEHARERERAEREAQWHQEWLARGAPEPVYPEWLR